MDCTSVGAIEGSTEAEFGEEAAVDEVGRCTAGFECEGTEFEDVGFESFFDQVGFPGWERHVGCVACAMVLLCLVGEEGRGGV